MTADDLCNALGALQSIDRHMLRDAGVICGNSTEDGEFYQRFRTDPFRTFLRVDDKTRAAIFGLIRGRDTTHAGPWAVHPTRHPTCGSVLIVPAEHVGRVVGGEEPPDIILWGKSETVAMIVVAAVNGSPT